jgi:signal peptide peptidase SppA
MLKPNLLSRLFSRGQGGPLVPQIYSRVINRPLLVEPAMADALIDSWLRGGVEAGAGGEPRQILEHVGHVAVLDVSGPLIARAVEPVCGVAPTSYEGLMLALDEIEADANITHVVLRLETPGGEAAQVFDLTDRMAELRSRKTLIAMVDDYAYSGGYAIAAACSEIWITRTGGVGSVGVVIGHRDVSEANAKAGIKWTYVHSGAMKVAGNPNEPLSDEARGFMQGESDRLYELFTTSVARYRDMPVEAVQATEAGILFGQNAIDAGLADHLGTFRELMAELQGGSYTRKVPLRGADTPSGKEDLPDDIEPPEMLEEGDSAELSRRRIGSSELSADRSMESNGAEPLDAVSLAEQCQQHGLSAAIAIKERWSTSQLEAAVERAQEVRNLCTAAGMPQLAADYIAAGTGVEVVRGELASRLQRGPHLSNRQSAVSTHSTADAWRRTMKKIGA